MCDRYKRTLILESQARADMPVVVAAAS